MMFIVGAITSATLVIPGVDFAVTLMALGYYTAFIGLVGDFGALFANPIRFVLLGVYLAGYGMGSFLFSKGLRFLIKRYPRQLNCVNIAMVAVAPVIVIKKCLIDNPNENTLLRNASWKVWVWAFAMFAIGYFAFTWIPALLRHFGILPKNTHDEAVQTQSDAHNEVPRAQEVPPVVNTAEHEEPSMSQMKREEFEEV